MTLFIVLSVVAFWVSVFVLTVSKKWGDIFRSLLNILAIQSIFIADQFAPYHVTYSTRPWLVTAVATSACSYNLCDIINMLRTGYNQTAIFGFHHAMVILGALLPIVSGQYYEMYVYGGVVELTSIAYNINAMYQLGYIGQHWSKQEKDDAYTAFVLFYSIVRTHALGAMLWLYQTEHHLASALTNSLYLAVTFGIIVFSVISVFEMLGWTNFGKRKQNRRLT